LLVENGSSGVGVGALLTGPTSSVHDGEEVVMGGAVMINVPNGGLPADRSSTNPSPLGFTMERFLSDGVVVAEGSRASGGGVGEVENEGGTTSSNRVEEEHVIEDSATTLNDGQEHHQDLMDHHHHQLMSPIEGESFGGGSADMDGVSMEGADPRQNASEILSSHLDSSSEMDVGDGVSGGGRGLIPGMGMSIHHHHHHHPPTNNDPDNHEPRLARLTEVEITEMAEIDYASVGNMPPRSVRDDDNEHHDLILGVGTTRTGQAFSEGTQTTLQESLSVMSGEGSSILRRQTSGLGEEGSVDRGAMESLGGQEESNMQQQDQEEVIANDALRQGNIAIEGMMDAVTTGADYGTTQSPNSQSPGRDSDNASIVVQRSEASVEDDGDDEEDDSNPQSLSKPPSTSGGTLPCPSNMNHVARAVSPIGEDSEALGMGQLKDPNNVSILISPTPCISNGFVTNNTTDPTLLRNDQIPINTPSSNYMGNLECSNYINNNSVDSSAFITNKYHSDTGGTVIRDSTNTATTQSLLDAGDSAVVVNDNTCAVATASGITCSKTRSYGAVVAQPFQRADSFHPSSEHGAVLGDLEGETRPLIKDAAEKEPQLYLNEIKEEAMGNGIVNHAFSSVMFPGKVNHNETSESSVLTKAFPKRFLSLVVTFLIEFFLLWIITMLTGEGRGENYLSKWMGEENWHHFVTFLLPISTGVSVHCGLQITTSGRFVPNSNNITKNCTSQLWLELQSVTLMSVGIGSVLVLLSFLSSGIFSFRSTVVIFLVNLVQMLWWTTCCLCLHFIEEYLHHHH